MDALLIMPCYNVEDTLLNTLLSVKNQTNTNFTLVCCDDKSTDSTLTLLHTYKIQYAFNFIILENDVNMGTGNTVNRCINEINKDGRYPFLTWISADNLLKPDFVECHISKLKEGYAITYSGFEIYTQQHGIIDTIYPNTNLLHLKECYKLGPSFFFSRLLFAKIGRFHSLPGEDYLFAVECALSNAKFGYINNVLVSYLKHDNSVSGRLEKGIISHKNICTPEAIAKAQLICNSNGDDIYL